MRSFERNKLGNGLLGDFHQGGEGPLVPLPGLLYQRLFLGHAFLTSSPARLPAVSPSDPAVCLR